MAVVAAIVFLLVLALVAAVAIYLFWGSIVDIGTSLRSGSRRDGTSTQARRDLRPRPQKTPAANFTEDPRRTQKRPQARDRNNPGE